MQRKKNFSSLAQILDPTLGLWKDQPTRQTWLDKSLAWVLTKVALLRMHNSPLASTLFWRSARSLPLIPPRCASTIIAPSRYFPTQESATVCCDLRAHAKRGAIGSQNQRDSGHFFRQARAFERRHANGKQVARSTAQKRGKRMECIEGEASECEAEFALC